MGDAAPCLLPLPHTEGRFQLTIHKCQSAEGKSPFAAHVDISLWTSHPAWEYKFLQHTQTLQGVCQSELYDKAWWAMLVFLQRAAPLSFKGEKTPLVSSSPLAHPAGHVPEQICMSHSLIWLIDLLFARSSTCFGPAPLLNVGDTCLPSTSVRGETDISLRLLDGRDFRLFCLYNTPGTWYGLSQYLLNKCLDE